MDRGLDGVYWDVDDAGGGVVYRGSLPMGRISQSRTRVNVSCYLHGCYHSVRVGVGKQLLVRWLHCGAPPTSDGKADRLFLRSQHSTIPIPTATLGW